MERIVDLTRQHEVQGRAKAMLRFVVGWGLNGSEDAGLVYAKQHVNPAHFDLIQRAATAALSSQGFAAMADSPPARAMLEASPTPSVLSRIPFLPAPFRTAFGVLAGAIAGSWVDEGAPIPVVDFASDRRELDLKKWATIVVTTKEWSRSPATGAIELLQRAFAIAERDISDTVAFDPDVVGSMTNGGTEITSTGSDAAAVETDVRALFAAFTGTNPYFVTGMLAARFLAFLRTTNGFPVFPNISLAGEGDIYGVPQFVSTGLDDELVLVDGDGIAVADGGLMIEPAASASLQMSTTPAAGAQNLVSLFQTNALAFRLSRYLNWAVRDGAAAFLHLPIGSPA
jgi:hypothetical protein